MADSQDVLMRRLDRLERINRRNNILLAVLGLTSASLAISGFADNTNEIKASKLTIVDEQGRSRVILAGKVPDPVEGKRSSTGPGMVILNEKGYEQFGLHLDDQGKIGMGFDAKPGAGDDRNRERINMWVTPDGSPAIRLMDGKTRVKSLWYLDRNETAWMSFLRWSGEGKATKYTGMKKIGLTQAEEVAKP